VLDEMQQLLAAADGPLGALLALREQVSACCYINLTQFPCCIAALGGPPQ
jgi:hypothetical protein